MKLQAKILIPILAVSLSQIARAVSYSSVASGDWSDPLTWNPPVPVPPPTAFPNTYASDNATVNAGHVINYTGGMTTPGGGFAVSNGKAVIIEGTLNQTTLTSAILVGEGSGGGATSTLTIRLGGTMDTGASVGLAVGTKISGAVAGDGVLNINDGLLKLGAGAAAGGFGVGIDESTGALFVGDSFGGAGSAIVDLATNNVQMGIGVKNPFSSFGAGTGTATIDFDGIINFGTGAISIGQGGGNGTLTVLSGGTITGTGGAILVGVGTNGVAASSVGVLNNDGTIGTAVLSTGEVRIGGGGGTGTLAMGSGSLTTIGEFNIGTGTGTFAGPTTVVSTGTATISGGTVSIGQTSIGRSGGNGTLTVSGGATTVTTNGQLYVGTDAGSVGTLTINGGTHAVTDFAKIGNNNGTGSFNISGGALNVINYLTVGQDGGIGTVNQTGGTVTFSQWAAIGVGGGAAGSQWNISGGNITSGAGIEVGADRGGGMNISGTPAGTNVNVGSIILGTRTNGNGLVNQTGGTVITKNLGIAGAQSGGAFGTYNLTGGANSVLTINPGGGQSYIGNNGGSVGTLNISGAGTVLNNVSGQDHQIGFNGGTGNLNITGGGVMNHNWWINIARGGTSTGQVIIDGAGSALNQSAGRINIGENGAGTLDIKNGGRYTFTSGGDDDSSVGRTGGSQGVLSISTGGSFNALSNAANGDPGARHGLRLYVGLEGDTSNGTINMVGGTLSLLSFTPGNQGAATINHFGGTINVGQWSEIGQDRTADTANNLAVYNLGGTAVFNTQQLFVGSRRTGTMNVTGGIVNVGTDGTVANNGWGGFSVGAFGTPDGGSHGNGFLTQTGGTINSIRGLEVGNQTGTNGLYIMDGASAVLNVNNGETHVGESGTGIMTVRNGAQAHLNGGWSAKVGDQNGSVGTLNVESGGQVTGNSWIVIGSEGGSNGTINISGASSAITLGGDGRLIVGRSGTALVNQLGGTVTMHGWGGIGLDNGTGTYNLLGGTLVGSTNDDYFVGRRSDGGTGFLNISGTARFNGQLNPAEPNVGNRQGTFLVVGDENGSHGTVTINDSAVVDLRQLTVGRNGEGTVNQNGGTVTIGQWLKIGEGRAVSSPTNAASYTLNGGIINTPELMVGEGRKGAMTVNGGTVNIQNGSFSVGRWAPDGSGVGGDGTLIQTGGVINNFGGDSQVGHQNGSKGLYQISGTGEYRGLTNAANGDPGARGGSRLTIGNENGSQGTMNINGGLVEVLSYTVGNQGSGTINQLGGTVNVGQWTEIGQDRNADTAANVSVYNLGGTGVLNTQQLIVGSRRNGTMNVSGGMVNVGTDGTVSNNGWGDFSVGQNGPGDGPGSHANGLLNQTGGTINSIRGLNVGNQAGTIGLYVMDGATAVLNINNAEAHIGESGTGTLTVKNGAQAHLNGGWSAKVGDQNGSVGTLNVESGGKVTGNSWIVIGSEGGSNGTVNMSGAASAISLAGDGRFMVARAGTGTLNQSGGTITIAGWSAIALDASGTGVYNLTGGSLIGTTGDDFIIGRQGNGTLNMTAGNITIPERIMVASDGGSFGTANLNGGVVTAHFLEIGGGTGSVSIGGGTLRANQNEGNFLRNFNPGNSELTAGGVTFDSNTFSITAQNSFDGAGGITKINNGTLTLTAVNTYFGGTTIKGGTLNINSDAALGNVAGGVAISNNATLQAAANVTTNRTITLGLGGGRIDTNGQTVILDTGSTVTGTSLTKVGNGILSIKGTQTYSALTTSGGVTNIHTAIGTGASSLTANATTYISANQNLASFVVGPGAEVAFGDSTPFAPEFDKPAALGGGIGLVPEPGSLGLLLIGTLGLMARRRRSR